MHFFHFLVELSIFILGLQRSRWKRWKALSECETYFKQMEIFLSHHKICDNKHGVIFHLKIWPSRMTCTSATQCSGGRNVEHQQKTMWQGDCFFLPCSLWENAYVIHLSGRGSPPPLTNPRAPLLARAPEFLSTWNIRFGSAECEGREDIKRRTRRRVDAGQWARVSVSQLLLYKDICCHGSRELDPAATPPVSEGIWGSPFQHGSATSRRFVTLFFFFNSFLEPVIFQDFWPLH